MNKLQIPIQPKAASALGRAEEQVIQILGIAGRAVHQHTGLLTPRARGVHETSHAFGVESRLGKDQDMPTLGHGPTHLLGRPANERRVAQQRRAHPADIRFRAPRTYRLLRLCGLFQFRAHSLHPFYG